MKDYNASDFWLDWCAYGMAIFDQFGFVPLDNYISEWDVISNKIWDDLKCHTEK